jgi:AcrR family transcriptional regulator
VRQIRSKLVGTNLAPRDVDPVIGLLLDATARAYYIAQILRAAAPKAYTRLRIEDALADVVHRTLFGVMPEVNVHEQGRPRLPPLEFDRAATPADTGGTGTTDAARGSFDALLACGREVFITRGYHGTRVDDVVDAAGLSHGAFYRYFTNKAHFVRSLVLAAMEPLSSALASIPVSTDGLVSSPALRAWLHHYNETQLGEAAVIRLWIDATLHEPALGADAAAAIDWGRRQMVRFLSPRGFGDVDAEAVIALAVLDAFGAHRRSTRALDATLHAVEHGLLGMRDLPGQLEDNVVPSCAERLPSTREDRCR